MPKSIKFGKIQFGLDNGVHFRVCKNHQHRYGGEHTFQVYEHQNWQSAQWLSHYIWEPDEALGTQSKIDLCAWPIIAILTKISRCATVATVKRIVSSLPSLSSRPLRFKLSYGLHIKSVQKGTRCNLWRELLRWIWELPSKHNFCPNSVEGFGWKITYGALCALLTDSIIDWLVELYLFCGLSEINFWTNPRYHNTETMGLVSFISCQGTLNTEAVIR